MKHVVINSIGTAHPSAAQLLASSLKLPQEYFLKQFYNTPSLLFESIDDELAFQTMSVLSELGLEVSIQEKLDELNFTHEQGDISITIENINELPTVLQSIANFLGSSREQVFGLLLNEPTTIIGQVSEATALALQKRTTANVCFTIPKHDFYTIFVKSGTPERTIQLIEKESSQQFSSASTGRIIKDLPYEFASKIWSQFRDDPYVTVLNQEHQEHRIELVQFNVNNDAHKTFLHEIIGIPENVMPLIKKDLPITLFESISGKHGREIQKSAESVGVELNIIPLYPETFHLQLNEIGNLFEINEVLKVFFSDKDLPTRSSWVSPKPISRIVMRYLAHQLGHKNCQLTITTT